MAMSYSPYRGQISSVLSNCLHLLIGFNSVKVNHGGRLTAMFEEDQKTVRWAVFPTNGVRALVIVKGDRALDAARCLSPKRADKRTHLCMRRPNCVLIDCMGFLAILRKDVGRAAAPFNFGLEPMARNGFGHCSIIVASWCFYANTLRQ